MYVSDAGHSIVDKFGPEGKYLNQLTGRCEDPGEPAPCTNSQLIPFGELRGVAVDPSGNLWVESNGGRIDEFNDAAENEFALSECEAAIRRYTAGIAVNSNDQVYLVESYFHNV